MNAMASTARILFALARGVLALMIGVTASAASTPAPTLGEMIASDADFAGFVTGIEPGGDRGVVGKILAESHANKRVQRYAVTVTRETRIFRRDGGDIHPADFDTLELRDRIQLWFTGPATKSFPAQVTARQVVITKPQ